MTLRAILYPLPIMILCGALIRSRTPQQKMCVRLTTRGDKSIGSGATGPIRPSTATTPFLDPKYHSVHSVWLRRPILSHGQVSVHLISPCGHTTAPPDKCGKRQMLLGELSNLTTMIGD